MNKNNPNMHRDALLYRSLTPKGHRPRTDEEIEGLLNSVDPAPMSKDKLARMLRKVTGAEPTFMDSGTHLEELAGLTVAEQELAVLCRSKGQPLPPDLDAKIKAMEARAAQRPTPKDEA